MTSPLIDAFRHNAWANRELISFCRGLTDEQLCMTATGTYGSILETLQHQIGSESFYRFLFTGSFSDWDWHDDELPSLNELHAWASELAASWEQLLSQSLDTDAVLDQTTPNGVRHLERAGIVLAQVLHHANVHREQVCMILTTLGIEPPSLGVGIYGKASGRSPAGPSSL